MMRKILLFALVSMPFLLISQAQRTVLIEEWTNASCGPCATQNPAFQELLNANLDNVVAIKYQWYFPGYDPMHEQNPDEVNNRGEHYGLNGVPTAWIDGAYPDDAYADGAGDWDIAGGGYEGGPYGYNQAVLDWAGMQTTPIEMSLTHSLNEEATELTVNVSITNVSAEDFTMTDGKLQVALLEHEIAFPTAPGSNGETEFFDVMRKMYPDENGTAVGTIAPGETVDFVITGDIPSYIYGLTQMRVAAFVEDYSAFQVWQAAITDPQPIANAIDGGFGENLTAAPMGLCGASLTPSVEFVNGGSVDITQAVIDAQINGNTVGSQTYEGTLAPGEMAVITFDEVALTEANSTLTFEISEINNGVGVDINGLNNSIAGETYAALSDVAIGTELLEDHEAYVQTYPATGVVIPGIPLGEFGGNSFVVYAMAELPAGPGDPIGGFGLSDRSMLVNFYQWNPAGNPSDASVIFQKVDLTTAMAPALQFDRASASYDLDGVSGDRLQVLISTDCAATFDVIWDETGAGLNTAPASNPYYVPAAADWETATIDLSAYIGQEVNVQFKAFSAWGNNLYLDNINVLNNLVGTEELTEVTELSLFPNPVKETLNVRFNLEEASQLQVEVFNATGQRVQSLGVQNYSNGQNQLNLDAATLPNGVYFLRMYNADRELNRRFVVQH